ncbi:MAG: hypothetical protein WCI18_13200 [Pseudomonadota bacterium]
MALASKQNAVSSPLHVTSIEETPLSARSMAMEVPSLHPMSEVRHLHEIWDFSVPDFMIVDKKMLLSDFSGDEEMLVGYLERAGSYLMVNLDECVQGLKKGDFGLGLQALVRMRGIGASLRAQPLTDAITRAISFFESKNGPESLSLLEALRAKIMETNCELLKIRNSIG